MPIEVQTRIKVFNQEEYHALNRRALGVVFEFRTLSNPWSLNA
jgi:hypothetical protein